MFLFRKKCKVLKHGSQISLPLLKLELAALLLFGQVTALKLVELWLSNFSHQVPSQTLCELPNSTKSRSSSNQDYCGSQTVVCVPLVVLVR